jgi:hypothetical protein
MTVSARSAHRRRRGPGQRGAAMLLLILSLIALGATVLLTSIGLRGSISVYEREARHILEQSRSALLVYLSSADLDSTGRRLGEFRLYPDLPIAAGAGADASEPSYDGLAEIAGCASRTWLPGAALTAPNTAGASARCFGRLPWRALGLSLPSADIDESSGLVPWVVYSPNLASPAACLGDLNPLMARSSYSGYACPTAVPYPWITVLDERGNVLSDRVAFALILPGPALAGQVRSNAALPSAYLDRVTIAASCPLPCVPGSYDNAAYAHADGNPTVLIRATPSGRATERISYYGNNYEFNDRLIYVTVDEYLSVMETRARREVISRLRTHRSNHGYFPFASAFDTLQGDCVLGLRFGHLPTHPGLCLPGEELNMPAWFNDAGWQRYFVYAVSARCNRLISACDAPALTVGAQNNINALLLSPSAAITTAPFAASKSAVQTPLIGTSTSASAADYLDSIENAGGLVDVFEATGSPAAPSNDRMDIIE